MYFAAMSDANLNTPLCELSALFNKAAVTAENCAHLCIDVQNIFTAPDIAAHIAETITPAFRKAGMTNYWVHFSQKTNEAGMPVGGEAFCEVKPLPGDPVIRKTEASAFEGSDINAHLQANHIKLVVLTGFAFGCCVRATARDAQKNGYQTIILTDGTYSEGKRAIKEEMVKDGIILTSSQDFFTALQANRNGSGTPAIKPLSPS